MSSPSNTVPVFENIRLERDDQVTWLVLNRPHRLNALSDGLMADYAAALDHLAEDRETKVIVVRGEGRSFSSGYDVERDQEEIGGSGSRSSTADRRRLERNIEIFMKAWRHPKPVIAAVHGHCLAGGAQLATLCDITVVTTDAVIGTPSLPLGGGYVSPMWVPLVGPKRAKQLTFQTGPSIDGATAAAWGWANYAVEPGDLLEDVTALARRIALLPRDLVATKKAAINRAADISLDWSTVMPLGAETDALLHRAGSVQYLNEAVRRHGLKETIRAFRAGEHEVGLEDGA
jgi:enoyl-CoA hydratase